MSARAAKTSEQDVTFPAQSGVRVWLLKSGYGALVVGFSSSQDTRKSARLAVNYGQIDGSRLPAAPR